MKTKILLLFSAILLSMSLQAQNSIDIVSPPASVEGNTFVDITFNYTLAVPGYAYIRFKNGPDSENNITYISKLLAAGSGTETLSLEIPRSFNGVTLPLGSGYNYQAQLFDHNNGWVGLDTKDYNGVTLTAAANFISLTTFPTTVNVNGSVDVTFDYATDKTPPVYAFVRLHNTATGEQLSSTTAIELTSSSGTHIANLAIPNVTLGSGYEYRVLLFHPTNWGAAFASDKITGITAAAELAPANSITLTTAPTTVAAGSDVNITFDYVTDVANAHIFVRFKDDINAEGLTSVSQIVTAGSGTLTLPLPIPVDKDGTALPFDNRYLYQVQLFDIDAGYANIISENIPGITLAAAPANTVVINNPPSPVLTSSTTNINVSYTKDISGDLFVVLNFLDGGGNAVATEFGTATGNSGDIVFNLAIPATEAEDYSYNVQLLGLTGSALYQKTYRGITVTSSLSTNNFNENFKNLSIYPNPFKDSFTYKFDDNLSDSTLVELFTIDGKKITTIENNTGSFGNSGTINTKSLSRGMYLVRITSGSLQGTKKLIKN